MTPHITYRTGCRAQYLVPCALMLALCISLPPAAFSQSLPWQTNSQSTPQAQPASQSSQQTPPSHHHHHAKKSEHASASGHGERKKDDRKLDTLATKYYDISSKDKHAIEKLKKLEGEVAQYRSALKQRDYNASDILKDAGKLEARIAAQRKKLEAEAAPAPTPAAVISPAVVTPAPTSTSPAASSVVTPTPMPSAPAAPAPAAR